MSLVIDTIRASTISEELNDAELGILAELFEIKSYDNGEIITQPNSEHNNSLFILAKGDIEVKINSANEQTTILHVMKKGELAGMITFVGGPASSQSADLHAVGSTQVICMERTKFERLINTHPMIVYKVMRGIVRNLHNITRQMNAQTNQLSNYINRAGGRG